MNIILPDIQIVRLETIIPDEPFGKVAKAAEVLDYRYVTKDWKCQMIELPPDTSFEPHYHISEHIVIIEKGSGRIAIWESTKNGDTVNSYKDSMKVYNASVGNLIYIPKDVVHAFSALEEGLREVIINNPGLELNHPKRINWI